MDDSRRDFLKWIGVGSAAAVLSKVSTVEAKQPADTSKVKLPIAVIIYDGIRQRHLVSIHDYEYHVSFLIEDRHLHRPDKDTFFLVPALVAWERYLGTNADVRKKYKDLKIKLGGPFNAPEVNIWDYFKNILKL